MKTTTLANVDENAMRRILAKLDDASYVRMASTSTALRNLIRKKPNTRTRPVSTILQRSIAETVSEARALLIALYQKWNVWTGARTYEDLKTILSRIKRSRSIQYQALREYPFPFGWSFSKITSILQRKSNHYWKTLELYPAFKIHPTAGTVASILQYTLTLTATVRPGSMVQVTMTDPLSMAQMSVRVSIHLGTWDDKDAAVTLASMLVPLFRPYFMNNRVSYEMAYIVDDHVIPILENTDEYRRITTTSLGRTTAVPLVG